MPQPFILLNEDVASACRGDAAALAALDAKCFPEAQTWSAENYQERIESKSSSVLLVRVGRQVVASAAYAWHSRTTKNGMLTRVCVDPEFRRRTIGKQLLAVVMTKVPVPLHVTAPETELETVAVFLRRCGFHYLRKQEVSSETTNYILTSSEAEAAAFKKARARTKISNEDVIAAMVAIAKSRSSRTVQ